VTVPKIDPVVVWAKTIPVNMTASAMRASRERKDHCLRGEMVLPESMVSPEGDAAGVPIRFKYEVSELARWERGRLVGEAAGNCVYELEPVTIEGRLTNVSHLVNPHALRSPECCRQDTSESRVRLSRLFIHK
jgi:hypothetical protein